MSAKTEFRPSKASKYHKFAHQRQERIEANIKANVNAKNHVSEDVKSKGGLPFHFAGPKKAAKKGSK